MNEQVNSPENASTNTAKSILGSLNDEVTAYINSFIERNADGIIAAAEEKARATAERIIAKAKEKAEAEIERIILESRAEVERNAELTIKEAGEMVSWFVLEVSAHVTEEAQAMKREIIERLVVEKSQQIITRAEEKAREAAKQIVAKAREKAEAEARIIIEKAKEAAERSLQEIAKGADEEASRMVIHIRDAEDTDARSKDEEAGHQTAAVSEHELPLPGTARGDIESIMQESKEEPCTAVVEVKETEAAKEQPVGHGEEKVATAVNEARESATKESKLTVEETAAEAEDRAAATEVPVQVAGASEAQPPVESAEQQPAPLPCNERKEAGDKAKGRVIEFVPDMNDGKNKAARLTKEELGVTEPPQTKVAASKADKPSITQPGEPKVNAEMYKDLVELALVPPIALDQMLKLHKYLKNTPNIKVVELTGSLDKGVKMRLFLMAPTPLLSVLEALPEVEMAEGVEDKKPVPAGHHVGSEPALHTITVKMKK
jgi:F0F1-type ATP synthase membrane subunit b/b'